MFRKSQGVLIGLDGGAFVTICNDRGIEKGWTPSTNDLFAQDFMVYYD